MSGLESLRHAVSNFDDYELVAEATVQFEYDQDKLTREAKEVLDQFAANHHVPYLHTAAELLQESGENPEYLYYTYFQLAYSMWIYDKPDSALFYVKKGLQFLEAVKKLKHPTPWLITGNVYRYVVKNIDSSEFYYREGIRLSGQFNSLFLSAVLYFSLGNVFFEKNGKLVTPPTGNILPGITRATVIEICASLNIPVEERSFTTDELKQADAAFFCGTAAEVIGWQSLDEAVFPASWNDSVGRKIQVAYKERVLEGKEELVNEK
jgi:branched-subunit amino acid aminotransferase/4-amino-4-deoxychorismate lyase